MSPLDKRKRELDLRRIQTAKFELELKIDEKLEEVENLKKHIDGLATKEQELIKEIESYKQS